MNPIGVGLGSCYKQAAKKALDRFAFETTNSMTNFSASADNQSSLSDLTDRSK